MTFAFATNFLDLEYKMKKILHLILISLFCLTLISCAKKDEEKDEDTPSYVVVGASGTILTSSDGTTWTSRTSGTSYQLKGVTFTELTL